MLAVAALVGVPAAGWAHGDDESEEGYLLIQQALAHLAHDTGHEGMELATEKVDDALEAEDQEGVDVSEVEDALAALEAGDADAARDLLQGSIEEAVEHLPPAIGDETGTTVVAPETSGGARIDGQGAGFLVASVAALLLGVWLALRFRPRDTVRELRRSLAHAGTGEDAGIEDAGGRGGRS